jgi:deferrochelatase/peroxidase EfeB
MSFSHQPFSEADFKDIQGLVRHGHGHLEDASFHLLKIMDAAAARAWLASAPITTAASDRPPEVAVQVAFTYEGLKVLGVSAKILQGFSDEFIVGMTGDESRSRRLGDVGQNDPGRWKWGQSGTMPHMIVMLYARRMELAAREAEIRQDPWAMAFQELYCLSTNNIGDIEPFGFKDGISQPVLDWRRTKPARLRDTFDYTNLSALGEFLLGYPNEYTRYTDRPLVEARDDPERILRLAEDKPGKRDFGRNGTYMVVRDLSQDVCAFWRYIDEQAHHDPQMRMKLAHAMVGRTMDGDPIVRLRPEPIEGISTDPEKAWENQFTFENDSYGTACPFGAHIRRANPRNADLPSDARRLLRRVVRVLGFGSRSPRDDLLSSTRFHRILRRGREFGKQMSAQDILGDDSGGQAGAAQQASETDACADRGMRFVCLNANISRQFEFIQTAWLANPKFDGIDERDPLVGERGATEPGATVANTFTQPQENGLNRRVTGLGDFVIVRGGAYFFMPSMSALRYISRIN